MRKQAGKQAGMRKKIIWAVIIMGFSGLVAQIVLLRELMIAFLGNELSIGVILANWLMLESAGAFFLGKKISQARSKRFWFILVTMLFSLLFVAAIHAARVFKGFLPLVPGEGLGLPAMFYVSFLILLPVSLLHGALFTAGCKLYAIHSNASESRLKGTASGAVSIARVYIFETLGTIAGGVLLTYLLIPYLHSFQIACVLAFLNIGICALLMEPFWKSGLPMFRRAASLASLAMLLLIVAVLAGPAADRMNRSSVEQQWENQQLLHYQNSHYGNIVVVERAGEYTFFSDGVPVITTPNPDIVFMEEYVHFALLSHPSPQKVLILSGGAGGVINEVLKHRPERIDYAEVDPLIPQVIRQFPTPLTEKEFQDERVHIKDVDGRFYLKRTTHTYDVIFSGFSDPSTLQSNRFFTREFFALAHQKLTSDGMLVIAIPGSLTYISPELADLNAVVYNTLQAVFPSVRIIPGDGTNLYIASPAQNIMPTGHEPLIESLHERLLPLSLITPAYLEYRLHPRRLQWFYAQMEGSTEAVNRDFKPVGVFYSLVYWNEKFSPDFNRFFKLGGQLSIYTVLGFILAFSVVFSAMATRTRRPLKPALGFCIFTTGFAGMLFDLVLIFAFQVLYGYIFYWLGLLVTAFMAGVMVGSLRMTAYMKKKSTALPALIKLEVVLVVFALLLPLVFLHAGSLLAHTWFDYSLRLLFLVLSFFSGVLVGAEFPLANKEYLRIAPDLGGTAGLLYSADLMGGWLGGMIGAVVLLPVLGLYQSVVALALLKICSVALLIISSKSANRKSV